MKAPSGFVSPGPSASHVTSGDPVTEMFSLSISSRSSFDDEISVILVLPASGDDLGLLVLVGNLVCLVIELSRSETKGLRTLNLNNLAAENERRSSTLTSIQKRSFHAIDGGQHVVRGEMRVMVEVLRRWERSIIQNTPVW